jgi:hypothetical protein
MIYEGLKNEISYQIKIVKKSSYMSYLSNDGLTPFKIQGVTGAAKKPLDQLCGQLNELFNLIKLYKKG